ncbi:MAG: hypothetical protein ABWZ78_04970 [Burkholderiaceae bacterium]
MAAPENDSAPPGRSTHGTIALVVSFVLGLLFVVLNYVADGDLPTETAADGAVAAGGAFAPIAADGTVVLSPKAEGRNERMPSFDAKR